MKRFFLCLEAAIIKIGFILKSCLHMSHPEAQSSDVNPLLRGVVISFCIFLCLLPPVQALAPRALGFLPAAIGILFLIALRFSKGAWPEFNRLYAILALGCAALAALSSLWSMDPGFALERGFKIALVLGGGFALFSLLRSEITWPSLIYRAFPIALLAAGILCAFELWSNGLIHHTWRGTGGSYNLSMINRAVTAFVLVLLPGLGFLEQASYSRKQKRLIQLAFLIITAVIIYRTHSQSSHLALLLLVSVWVIAPVFRFKAAQLGLMALMCAGILAGPWLVQFLYNTVADNVQTMPWFANAYAADRLEIWDFVARKALENPLYGFGIEATRHVEHFETAMRYTPLDHVLHPHNAVLQIWIEFGLLGIAGLCGAILCILHKIFNIKDEQSRRLCLAVFIASFAVACTAYGLWQGWWLGLFTFTAALCGHIVRIRQ